MKQAPHLSTGTKIAYGFGNVGIQGVVALVSFFLLFYYTDVAKIPIGIASTALFVAKIWDIINDPLFGWISDRTRSRFGRRRVYLIFGAVPLAVVTFLAFSLPKGLDGVAAFLSVMLSFMLFDTLLTLVAVPYSAMSAELTHDYDERTTLVTYSSIGAVIGFFVGGALAPRFFDIASTPEESFRVIGLIYGLLAGVSVAVVAYFVRPPTSAESKPTTLPVMEAVTTTLRNLPFVRLIFAFGLARFGFTMISAALTYYVVHWLHTDKQAVGKIIGVMLLFVVLFIPFWRRVAFRASKGYAYAMGLLVTGLGMAAIYPIGQGQSGAVLVMAAVIGFGIAAHWVIPWAMLPDVVEFDQLETGQRREGMYFGVYGLVDKIFRTLGLVAVGWVLALFGYEGTAEVAGQALTGIRVVTSLLPGLFLLFAVPILLSYPVTRESHRAVRKKLGEVD